MLWKRRFKFTACAPVIYTENDYGTGCTSVASMPPSYSNVVYTTPLYASYHGYRDLCFWRGAFIMTFMCNVHRSPLKSISKLLQTFEAGSLHLEHDARARPTNVLWDWDPGNVLTTPCAQCSTCSSRKMYSTEGPLPYGMYGDGIVIHQHKVLIYITTMGRRISSRSPDTKTSIAIVLSLCRTVTHPSMWQVSNVSAGNQTDFLQMLIVLFGELQSMKGSQKAFWHGVQHDAGEYELSGQIETRVLVAPRSCSAVANRFLTTKVLM